jgi:5'(3')-deoxyribonucleotidase
MIPRTVYLDMDGVITDFSGGVMNHFGLRRLGYTTNDIKQWNWFGDFGLDEKAVSEFLSTSRKFWAGLDWTPGGKILFSILHQMYGEDLWLLTTPWVDNEACRGGKLDWVNKNIPCMTNNVIFNFDKSKLATPWSILIDDREETVEKFRAAGGIGILIPRTWNSKGKI